MVQHSSKRSRLNEIRKGITQRGQVAGLKYYVTVNFFDNTAKPGEVFVKVAKEGSTVSGLIDVLCITISIALQYGVKWEILKEKYLYTIFEPQDEKSTSLVDGLAKTISGIIEYKKQQKGMENVGTLETKR